MLHNGEAKTHTSENILVAGAGIPCRSLKGASCDSRGGRSGGLALARWSVGFGEQHQSPFCSEPIVRR